MRDWRRAPLDLIPRLHPGEALLGLDLLLPLTRLNATLGLVFDPYGRPLCLGGSAGPRSPSGIRLSGTERTPQLDGPGVPASPDVEDEGDVGGGAIASAAIPALSCLGSSSTLGGLTSMSNLSSRTNSADLILDTRTDLALHLKYWRSGALGFDVS